jgi:hypothetical protein
MHSWSRTILAFRAAGVLLIGLGVVVPAETVVWLLGAAISVTRSNAPVGFSRELAERFANVTAQLGWALEHSPSLLAVAAGTYLTVRTAPLLVPPLRSPPASASPVHE